MSRIEIRKKLRPFSTRAGIQVPLPAFEMTCKIYPMKVIFEKKGNEALELYWKFSQDPQKIVTTFDLFHQRIEVQLTFESGVFYYDLIQSKEGLVLNPRRQSCGSASFKWDSKTFKKVSLKENVLLLKDRVHLKESMEQLSLGSHKKQEIERIFKDEDFKEILPMLFNLGQYASETSTKAVGSLKVIEEAYKLLVSRGHDQILSVLKPLLSSAFSGIFVPHIEDVFHWRQESKLEKCPTRFALLEKFYKLIRAFFIESSPMSLSLLPHLPKELFCGRLLQIKERDLLIDLEWTKKKLRRLKIKSLIDQSIQLKFQKGIQKCRLRVDNKSMLFKNTSSQHFEKNKTYLFDRFES